MIIDRLDNRDAALEVPARVRQALDYLRATDLRSLPPGRHDIDGDRLFALVQDYTTRPADQCNWEAHRKYIDVQYVVEGVERMGVATLETARVREPYDDSRDVAFFEPGSDSVTLSAGMFAIFHPSDVHAPGGAADVRAPSRVRKVVIKAAITT